MANVVKVVEAPGFKSSSRVAAGSAMGASSSQITKTDPDMEDPAIKVEAEDSPMTDASEVAAAPAFDPALVQTIAAGIAASVIPTPAAEVAPTETVREVFYRWRSKQEPWRAQ